MGQDNKAYLDKIAQALNSTTDIKQIFIEGILTGYELCENLNQAG